MMINYEVNLELNPSIEQEFIAWLPQHVEQVLQNPGFEKATILFDTESEAATVKLVVNYEVESNQQLENYLNNNAKQLRQDAIDKFGDKFSIKRRVLCKSQEIKI